MSRFLLAAYEHLRQRGTYETDWIDRLCWKIFAVFMIVVMALG